MSRRRKGTLLEQLREAIQQKSQTSTVWGMWHWNGALSTEEIKRQCLALIEAGFNGIIIRPVSGMAPRYLSEEFFQLWKTVLVIAKERGIGIMLGDDFLRPAHSTFQATVERSRNFRSSRLTIADSCDLEQGDTFSYTPDPLRKEYVVAVERDKRTVSLANATTLYDGEGSATVNWETPEGYWKVITFVVLPDTSADGDAIPNVLSMKVGQHYATDVLDSFKSLFLPEFSDTFQGVFCEMPALLPSAKGFPWDDELLVSKYRSRFKRNLIETMPALFFGVSDHEAKYRPHVYSFLQDTLYERFPTVLQKWCDSNTCAFWLATADTDSRSPETALRASFPPPGQHFRRLEAHRWVPMSSMRRSQLR